MAKKLINKKWVIVASAIIIIIASSIAYVSLTNPSNPEGSSLMVYCGAGMRKPMDEIGVLFEQEHGITVEYNYAGSNTLLSQINITQQGDVYMPGATMIR